MKTTLLLLLLSVSVASAFTVEVNNYSGKPINVNDNTSNFVVDQNSSIELQSPPEIHITRDASLGMPVEDFTPDQEQGTIYNVGTSNTPALAKSSLWNSFQAGVIAGVTFVALAFLLRIVRTVNAQGRVEL